MSWKNPSLVILSDREYYKSKSVANIMENNYRYFPRLLLVKFIRLYQKTLSFDYGWFSFLFPHGYCRFHPTCSEYGIQAITKYGAVKGAIKASWRILRCHPWHKGGFDPMK